MTDKVRKYCFTINNPDIEWTGDELPNDPAGLFVQAGPQAKYIIYSYEIGQDGTPHLQGLLHLKSPQRITAIHKWGGEWERAHLEPQRGTDKQADDYASKEGDETHVAGPWRHGTLESEQGRRTDLEAAMATLKETRSIKRVAEEHPNAFARYSKGMRDWLKTTEQPEKQVAVLRPWQSDLEQLILGEPDARKIRWYIDETGNTGKTWMGKYLVTNHGAMLLGNGKHDRILYAVQQARPRIIVFDFPRDTVVGDNDKAPYGPMEAIKNGTIFSGMYGDGPTLMPIPHMICFSNFEPDLSKFSQDRWDIVRL